MGVEESKNFYTAELPEKEFVALIKPFALMNEECKLLIDDYESETISDGNLVKCQNIIAGIKDSIPVFANALEMAIRNKTILALDF